MHFVAILAIYYSHLNFVFGTCLLLVRLSIVAFIIILFMLIIRQKFLEIFPIANYISKSVSVMIQSFSWIAKAHFIKIFQMLLSQQPTIFLLNHNWFLCGYITSLLLLYKMLIFSQYPKTFRSSSFAPPIILFFRFFLLFQIYLCLQFFEVFIIIYWWISLSLFFAEV